MAEKKDATVKTALTLNIQCILSTSHILVSELAEIVYPNTGVLFKQLSYHPPSQRPPPCYHHNHHPSHHLPPPHLVLGAEQAAVSSRGVQKRSVTCSSRARWLLLAADGHCLSESARLQNRARSRTLRLTLPRPGYLSALCFSPYSLLRPTSISS